MRHVAEIVLILVVLASCPTCTGESCDGRSPITRAMDAFESRVGNESGGER